MNKEPDLSVIIANPASVKGTSDFLWSVFSDEHESVEVVVALDFKRFPAVASLVVAAARKERRLRIVELSGGSENEDGIVAALGAATGRFVAVASDNCVPVDGGYRTLVERLDASGSDLAVGVAESIARSRHRITGATEDALESDGSSLTLADRPALINDDLLYAKVARRELFERSVRSDGIWLDQLISARLLASAGRIDVAARTVMFCGDNGEKALGSPMSERWIHGHLLVWEALAEVEANIRERFARGLIERKLLSDGAIRAMSTMSDNPDARDLAVELAEALDSASLSYLPALKRWQFALIAAGRSSLVGVAKINGLRLKAVEVPAFDLTRLQGPVWASLGMKNSDELRNAFVERFVESRPVEEIPPVADVIDISVIIPTFNVASYIDELLESIRASVGVRLEIIVVDDGSTDGTWERIVAHHEVDPRVMPLRAPGAGGGQARDAGIEVARGEFLAFADGDDLVPPNAYRRMLAIARDTGAQIVNGSYLKFFTTSTWNAGTSFNQAYAMPLSDVTLASHPQLARHRAVWNRLIRRDHWLRVSRPFPGVPRSNDIVAMMSVLIEASSIAVSPLPAYVYRDRPGNGSMTSAAGSVDYTVSYFSEESTCSALVQQQDSHAVAREYWAMVLESDGWNNLARYLSQRTSVEGNLRVSQQIRLLISRTPLTEFARLGAEERAVWALACENKIEDARTILTLRITPERVDLVAAASAIAAASESPLVSAVVINQLVHKHIMRRLINEKDREGSLSTVETLLLSRLEHSTMPLAPVPNSLEERLSRTVRARGTAVLPLDPQPLEVPVTISGGSSSLSLKGLAAVPNVVPPKARIVARKFRDGKRTRIPIGEVAVEVDSWSSLIPFNALPSPGKWILELEFRDELGLRRATLNIQEASRLAIPRRLRRVFASPSQNDHSLIEVRPSLVARLRRKARSVRDSLRRP